ncbi:hypothetical protein R9C00_00845 [Flammeovirgaceae bacterium SG7u.111]|nr:hypothetical protein [Flammeovirgaceae bacterium SG7u.132]WPO35996.1 hypothetical protein R9C00_00845 [Flammeovirgaceae bacterium SG7u.111]
MKQTIELNNHNKKPRFFNLILGGGFTSLFVINLTSIIGQSLNAFDVLSLIAYPIFGITWLLSGLGYNLTRFLKQEKLIINDSSLLHDSPFNKTIISFRQIQLIECKNKSLIISPISGKKIKIHLPSWDQHRIDEFTEELKHISSRDSEDGGKSTIRERE